MDLIYTNAKREDRGILLAYSLDLSFGEDVEENDFELILGNNETALEDNSVIYIEDTEYGGIVDGVKINSESEATTHFGRTWHGVMNSKVIEPDTGENYLVVSGDAHEVLTALVSRMGLSGLFFVESESSGITITKYRIPRYCKGYDGIRKMLAANGAKLKIRWEHSAVALSVVPISDYSNEPVDDDIAPLVVERHGNKVNHLICLGRGELSNREIVHLYIDQNGRITDSQVYTGLEEVTEIFDYSNAESLDELIRGGVGRLKELRSNDKVEVSIREGVETVYDICDIVAAIDNKSGNVANATIVQKIVRINNGAVSIEYQTGSQQATDSGGYSGGESGEQGGNGSGNTGAVQNLPIASKVTLGAIKVGNNLEIADDGTLSVNTTNEMESDNTLPITSAGVYATVGNIEVLLKTI